MSPEGPGVRLVRASVNIRGSWHSPPHSTLLHAAFHFGPIRRCSGRAKQSGGRHRQPRAPNPTLYRCKLWGDAAGTSGKGLVLCRTKLNLILLNHGAICVIMNLGWSDGVREDYSVELHQENIFSWFLDFLGFLVLDLYSGQKANFDMRMGAVAI